MFSLVILYLISNYFGEWRGKKGNPLSTCITKSQETLCLFLSVSYRNTFFVKNFYFIIFPYTSAYEMVWFSYPVEKKAHKAREWGAHIAKSKSCESPRYRKENKNYLTVEEYFLIWTCASFLVMRIHRYVCREVDTDVSCDDQKTVGDDMIPHFFEFHRLWCWIFASHRTPYPDHRRYSWNSRQPRGIFSHAKTLWRLPNYRSDCQ